MAGLGVDQAGCQLAGEGVIQAGLVAGDAGVDLILAALERLIHQIGIGQHRPRHRHQIGMAGGQHGFCHIGHVDAVRCDHRHTDMLADPPRHFGKGGTRHHGGDGGHLGFVPGEMGGDDGGARGFHRLGQLDHLLARHAALQHVHRRDAEHDDELVAHGGTGAADHLHREPHAVFETAAPHIGAHVGLLDQEGGQQIAGRSDDLHPVIARRLRLHRTIGEIGQLFFNAVGIQFVRREAANARADCRWGHTGRRAGQRPGVEDLQHDLHIRVRRMHGFGDDPMLSRFGRCRQFAAAAAFMIGRNAAGDDHPHPAARPLGEECRHAFEAAFDVLKAGVHRSHQDAVFQGGESQFQRGEHQGIAGMCSHDGRVTMPALGKHPAGIVQAGRFGRAKLMHSRNSLAPRCRIGRQVSHSALPPA